MKIKSLFFVLFLGLTFILQAGNITINTRKTTGIQIKTSSFNKVVVQNILSEIKTLEVNTSQGIFTELMIPDYSYTQDIGAPKMPVLRRLIEIPTGAEANIIILSSHFTEYSLQELELADIIPAQPPQIKDNKIVSQFSYDALAYLRDDYYPDNLASIDILGFMRGLRLARLNISPVQYNPVSRKIRVYDEINLEIQFIHPDIQATRNNKIKNHNPYFNNLNQYILNTLPSDSPMDTIIQYPVKYVIVSNPMFQTTLQPFVQWKKKKGFTVIEAYTNNASVGTTTTSIKNYLLGLYNAGNSSDPPPSFVLFVGDVAQLPTFAGTQGSHPTDLYFCEYTGDYLPDAYYGRFSAMNTTQLQAEIDKTLQYEQYTMPDPSFLNHCVMVAGTDPSYGPTHANGQINYGTSTYFNLAHGLTSHTYLYPASGSQDAEIIQNVSNGCCYANYTAHGSSSGWADPTFITGNVPSLTNLNKYPLMVGNACLTNKFDDAECFGEALIRATGKGALGYIGASNNTYWDEDFWWAVGAKPISPNPTYSATALGAYDRTFHDHGEAYDDWFMTQGQMVYAGNLAVAQGSPSSTDYYWEIYHLMGDPSLMVYFSQPPALAVSYTNPLPLGVSTFTVTTTPYAYAAISQTGVLHGAAQADASGIANIPITPFSSAGTADVVVTRQNYQPYIGTVTIQTPNAPLCMLTAHSMNDADGNNNGQADYGETLHLGLSLHNYGLQNANNIIVTISSTDTYVTFNDGSEIFGTINAGATVSLADIYSISLSNAIPDGHSILFQVSITDGTNTWPGDFSLIAHAPVLTYSNYTISDPLGNQNSKLDPGETDDLLITIQNTGSSTATNVTGTLSSNCPYITINTAEQNTLLLNGGTSAQQSYNISIAGNTPLGTSASFTLDITADNGITGTASFTAIIGQVPVLILNLDGNNNSAVPLQNAVLANNINATVETSFPVNLNLYSSIFICLGLYNNNHVLTNSEGTALANYLNNGGRLYMEGGDTWYYNTPTPVHPMFKITGLSDGTGDLDTLHGQNGTFTEGMHFKYTGDNSWVDRITPTTGSTALSILKNTSPVYATAIAYDDGTYKTIGANHEFAGLNNTTMPSTRNNLMKKYLEFFGLISTEVVPGFSANPTSLVQGNTVIFSDTSTGTPISWNWTFPGGTPATSSLQNPVITYNTPGIYPVSLTAVNAYGSATLVKNNYITVNPTTDAVISLGSYTGCSSTFKVPIMMNGLTGASSVSLMLNFNPAQMAYAGYSNINPALGGGIFLVNHSGSTIYISWVSLNPLTIINDTLFNLVFSPLSSGIFPLTWNTLVSGNCEITNLAGNTIPASFFNGQVEISPTPLPASVIISALPGTSVCAGSPVTFTAFPVNSGANPTYLWKVNGINAGSGQIFNTSIISNSDLVNCQLTSSASCATGNPATSNNISMNINSAPSVNLGNDTVVPFGQTLILTASAGYTSYLWSNGDTTPSITVSLTGMYSVSVTSSSGCTAQDSIQVTIISYNTITGTLTYSNTVQTPLGNVLIQLKSGNTLIAHTVTATDGSFTLGPVLPGTYTFNCVCTKPWGGVNATDALLTMKHFVGMTYLTGLYMKAGDIDASNLINALDALSIQRRSVGLLSSFPAGDWTFSKPIVVFTGETPIIVNLKGLCVGDVNGSHLPQ